MPSACASPSKCHTSSYSLSATPMLSWGVGRLLGCQPPHSPSSSSRTSRLKLQLVPAEVGTGPLPSLHRLSCSPASGLGAQHLGIPWLGAPSTPPAGISLRPEEGAEIFPISQGVTITRRALLEILDGSKARKRCYKGKGFALRSAYALRGREGSRQRPPALLPSAPSPEQMLCRDPRYSPFPPGRPPLWPLERLAVAGPLSEAVQRAPAGVSPTA